MSGFEDRGRIVRAHTSGPRPVPNPRCTPGARLAYDFLPFNPGAPLPAPKIIYIRGGLQAELGFPL